MAIPQPPGKILDQIERLTSYFRPSGDDPTYLVLKAHLLAEEILYEFLQKQTRFPQLFEDARLSFSQCLTLTRALHKFNPKDWWGWIALSKLNSLRNLLAHNLEPASTQDRIVEFTVFVYEAIFATKDTALGKELVNEYALLAQRGGHPFQLSLIVLHACVCQTLGHESAAVVHGLKDSPGTINESI